MKRFAIGAPGRSVAAAGVAAVPTVQSFLSLGRKQGGLAVFSMSRVGAVGCALRRASSGIAPTPAVPASSVLKGDILPWSRSLPGLDLAMRVAYPSNEFPATGPGGQQLENNDLRIMWREYFSLESSTPYYHNLITNETTHEIPDGFVTRFQGYYRRRPSEFIVDAVTGEVRHVITAAPNAPTSSGSGSPGTGTGSAGGSSGEGGEGGKGNSGESAGSAKGKPLTLKQKLAAYGTVGLLLYLIIHNTCLSIIFVLLYSNVDVVGFARSYGFNIKRRKSTEPAEKKDDAPPMLAVEEVMSADDGAEGSKDASGNSSTTPISGGEKVESVTVTTPTETVEIPKKERQSFFATLGIAIVLNKMTVPVQLALTLILAPTVVPRLQPFVARWTPKLKAAWARFRGSKNPSS